MTKKRLSTSEGKGTDAKIAKKTKAISFDGILRVIRLGTAEKFEKLLTVGSISTVNVKNGRGETLLMIQCINHCLKGVKLLTEHGAEYHRLSG